MEEDLIINELMAKTSGIDLSEIPMSLRLYNCLRRGGYTTLTDVMIESPDKFLNIRNFGKSCEEELFAIIQFIRNNDRDEIINYCRRKGTLSIQGIKRESDITDFDEKLSEYNKISIAEYLFGKEVDVNSVMFIDNTGEYCEDMLLNEIAFSSRINNALVAYGIKSLKDLSSMPYQTLLQIGGLGKKSIDEVLELIKTRINIINNTLNYNEREINEILGKIIGYFSKIIDEDLLKSKERELKVTIIKIFQQEIEFDVDSESFMQEMAMKNPINTLIRDMIKDSVSEKIYQGIDEEILLSIVSRQERQYEPIIKEVLDDLIQKKCVRKVSGKLYRYKCFLEEWINTLDGNYKYVLDYRCQGMTLEEIGNKISLTRERVRQLISNTLRKRPELFEDDYKIFVEKYDFEAEEFCTLFGISIFQVNYLLLSYKHGMEDVQTFLYDNDVPYCFKERVPVAFKGKVIVLDGECVPLKRDVLLKKLLKTYYSDSECSVEEFERFYLSFLRENGVMDRESLLFPNSRAFEARIADYPYSLTKSGHKIRYYDTEAIDLDCLFDAIDINRYRDMEISTLKLIRDCPNIMEQYDIRDEYELHNLIRKRIADASKYNISVTRMPLITIGNGDRVKQVEDLLLQMAPVTNIDLAKAYEEMYGVRSETVLANFFKPIDIFYHNGLFDLEQQEISEEDYSVLKSILTEEIYLWDEIIKKYREISKKPKNDAINAMTLKKLGFKVYSRYVISSNYSSADTFFTRMLLKDSCVILCEFKQGIRSITSFTEALNNLRDSLELIEVDRDVFYRFDYFAEKYNISSKNYLISIGQEVLSRLDGAVYFAVDALVRDSLLEDLPLVKNNVYVLNSLIRAQDGYKTSRITNVYIAAQKEYDISQLGLITHITNMTGGISIRELIDVLKEKYCINLDKSRIVYVIQESKKVFYDDIFDYIVPYDKGAEKTGPVYLENSLYASIISEKLEDINKSEVMIAKHYWNDKYIEFVDYCGLNNYFLMRDILKLDFRNLSENASKLNISKGTIADIVNVFIDWVNSLSRNENDFTTNESIIDLFFK